MMESKRPYKIHTYYFLFYPLYVFKCLIYNFKCRRAAEARLCEKGHRGIFAFRLVIKIRHPYNYVRGVESFISAIIFSILGHRKWFLKSCISLLWSEEIMVIGTKWAYYTIIILTSYMLDSALEPSYNLSKNLLLLPWILKLIVDMVNDSTPLYFALT